MAGVKCDRWLCDFICSSKIGRIPAKWEGSRSVYRKLNKLTDCYSY